MKKFFGILIAAFLLCLAGCNQNVGTDSSDLHGCSYVEVNTSKFISELEKQKLGPAFSTLSNKGYLVVAIDHGEDGAIYGIISDGNRPSTTEMSENSIKSMARRYGATDTEINNVINSLKNYGNACLAKVNGSKVTVYLF